MTDIFLRIPTEQESTYLVPDNAQENGFVYETGKYQTVFLRTAVWHEQVSSIHVNEDCSYSITYPVTDKVFDAEALRSYIAMWAEWSQKTGIPIMCNEFGIPVGLPKEARLAYMRSVLELFEQYNIPWCIYTNGLFTWTPTVLGEERNGTMSILPADGSLTLKDGNWYDEPMLELFGQFIK